MGISIDLIPSFGLGFAVHYHPFLFELAFGPFILMLGDLDAYDLP